MSFFFILITAVAAVLTYLGIAAFRGYSLRRQWLDVPNQRSSHANPTPRGAGLVVVPVCLVGYLATVQLTGIRFSWGYFVGALLVAIVSWLDDLYSISFVWRLMTHIAAGVLIVSTDGYWTTLSLGPDLTYHIAWLGSAVTVVWIVWVINAYNFMDGIDGIAALQGLAASAAWALIATRAGNGFYIFPSIVFASLLGFIVHNWHPAKVFIGDVGSAFLGFTFACMPLMFAAEESSVAGLLPVASILILWPFIFDTVLTLVRRLLRGEMVWQAHREHLYQRLVISGLSQRTVAVIYGIFATLTSAAAVLLVYGLISPVIVMAITLLASIIFAWAVGMTYKRRSPIAQAPHGA